MSPDLPFPLFRLPFLVLSDILKTKDSMELILLSLFSEKAKNIIRICRDKKIKWEIEIQDRKILLTNGSGTSLEIVAVLEKEYNGQGEISRIGGCKVQIYRNNNLLVITFWDHWAQGFKFVVSCILELFGQPIQKMTVSCNNIWMVKWVHERQAEKLKSGAYGNHINIPVSDEKFQNIIKNCIPTTDLRLQIRPSNNFQFTGSIPKIDKLSIIYGSWITLNNLLSMDSVCISIHGTKLKSSDMNLFIKHWLNGNYSRLKYVHIESQFFEIERMLEGLEAKLVDSQRSFRMSKTIGGYFLKSYDIKREDGHTATIFPLDHYFIMIVSTDSEKLVFG